MVYLTLGFCDPCSTQTSQELWSYVYQWLAGLLYVDYTESSALYTVRKVIKNVCDVTWNVEENKIQHEIFRTVYHVFLATFHVKTRKLDYLWDSVVIIFNDECVCNYIARNKVWQFKLTDLKSFICDRCRDQEPGTIASVVWSATNEPPYILKKNYRVKQWR